MAGRSGTRKCRPDPPDLPTHLDESPESLQPGALWDGVAAGAALTAAGALPNVRIRESVLTGVDLAGLDLSGLQVRDVRLERCDLSAADLSFASLSRVAFDGCRLTGANLGGAKLEDVVVRGASADLTRWRNAFADFLLIEDTSLREADFSAARLTRSGLLSCDLTVATFREAELTDVDLHGSQLADVRYPLSLAGASVDADSVIPLALSLLLAAGIQVTDQPRAARTGAEPGR